VPQYSINLAGTQGSLGHLLTKQDRPEQGLEWYARAIATLEGVLRKVKVDVIAQQFLRNAHAGRAQALDDLKRHAEAAVDWDKAVELTPPQQRTRVRMDRALSRVRAGQVDAAIQEAGELAKNATASTLYSAARVFALAADRPDESGGSLSKEECAKRAVALLQQAVARGFRDTEYMRKDNDLKALRERDDFKKLLAELEMKRPQ
jgi:tetratricopeptide (TPR) repeat protein